eukprot:scaffold64090_cov91-Cyclotella_meneghiniana.AAC.2
MGQGPEETQQSSSSESQAQNTSPLSLYGEKAQQIVSTEPHADEHSSPTSSVDKETNMEIVRLDVKDDTQINDLNGKDKEDNKTIETVSLVQSGEEDKSHTT